VRHNLRCVHTVKTIREAIYGTASIAQDAREVIGETSIKKQQEPQKQKQQQQQQPREEPMQAGRPLSSSPGSKLAEQRGTLI
jgi:hypothetical protein